jgi:2'-5' RNA ligase
MPVGDKNKIIAGAGTHHIAIQARNLDDALKLYHEVLGMPIIAEGGSPDRRILLLDIGDGSHIELFEQTGDTPAPGSEAPNDPVIHFALATTDTRRAIDHVRAAGYNVMPRLFVAIDIPEEIKAQLGGLKTAVPTARWVNPANFHLTLRFIGEIDAERVEPVQTALASVQGQPFDLRFVGVGRFPPSAKKAPRVLWAGLAPQPHLMTLQQRVETALEPVGFKPEARGFNPHITLARLRTHKPAPEAVAFLEANANFSAGPFHVPAFYLIESELRPEGAHYTRLATYTLMEG